MNVEISRAPSGELFVFDAHKVVCRIVGTPVAHFQSNMCSSNIGERAHIDASAQEKHIKNVCKQLKRKRHREIRARPHCLCVTRARLKILTYFMFNNFLQNSRLLTDTLVWRECEFRTNATVAAERTQKRRLEYISNSNKLFSGHSKMRNCRRRYDRLTLTPGPMPTDIMLIHMPLRRSRRSNAR